MSNKLSKTVFVAMSGGVDSSVAALLLKKQGYDVVGVFMRCYNLDGCAERDAEDARRVAEHLKIPFYTWDFKKEYKDRVVDYMVRGYRAGLTPNPDVMCNREIKFGLFLDKARAMGADYIATGHYVRLEKKRHSVSHFSRSAKSAWPINALYSARDTNKDQSYFLWSLTQNDLKYCLFPLGKLLKPEVRKIAARAGLPTAAKKDSQGICFLGKVSVEDFLKEYIPARRGDIVTVTGEKIGEHEGAYFYTIGQRHGLNLQQKNRLLGVHGNIDTKANYVAAKDIKKNKLVVAEGEFNEALFHKKISLVEMNFISPRPGANSEVSAMARVRYRQPLGKAILKVRGKKGTLTFAVPQKFVAEGQSAVWYSKAGEMLGGGIIA
ncbi:MAG: tRNA 2-thiouridine(34) synthase MnmA [Candidatus Liptonbacteria bacterium]